MVNHTLTEKNFETMTAVCSVDGPVNLRSRGSGRFCCSVKKSERHQRWAQRNPEKARANRRSRSAHRLTAFDQTTMTGECPLCGTVGVVVKGRRRGDGTPGVMCANRAKELWTNLDETPQERCSTCQRVYLNAHGGCSYCDDREATDLGYALKIMEERGRELDEIKERFDDELPFIVNPATYAAYSLDGDTVSNPAIKVIGAGVPAGTSPKRFIDQWWAANGHLV
jgi:hypothetical protein